MIVNAPIDEVDDIFNKAKVTAIPYHIDPINRARHLIMDHPHTERIINTLIEQTAMARFISMDKPEEMTKRQQSLEEEIRTYFE